MSSYRTNLPQLNGKLFLTDGGLETTLVFHEGIDLPCFAAFGLLGDAQGRETLRRYYRRYADIAVGSGCGFVLESPTWRANSDWGSALGYSPDRLADFNRDGIALMEEIRGEYADRAAWTRRIRGVRANASRCSHAELDEATELDAGDPEEFGLLHRQLRAVFPQISVLGGCCGTDHRHVEAIRAAVCQVANLRSEPLNQPPAGIKRSAKDQMH